MRRHSRGAAEHSDWLTVPSSGNNWDRRTANQLRPFLIRFRRSRVDQLTKRCNRFRIARELQNGAVSVKSRCSFCSPNHRRANRLRPDADATSVSNARIARNARCLKLVHRLVNWSNRGTGDEASSGCGRYHEPGRRVDRRNRVCTECSAPGNPNADTPAIASPKVNTPGARAAGANSFMEGQAMRRTVQFRSGSATESRPLRVV
jgi:hypothetical protein